MADFTLPVTVPDNQVAEFLDAMRWHYKMSNATSAELKTLAANELRGNLKQVFKAYKAHLLKTNPPSDEINIT
jgi:hypothetical protein